jgi:hypothetical protein
MVKRGVLGERKTNDVSTQLPEVSKESNGWDMGKNSGKNRKRSRPKQPRKDICFISGCNDIADKVVLDKVMLRQICTCGCKERREYAFCEDHFTKFRERQEYSFCEEHFIQLMFEEMVGKDNMVICISEEQSEKAEILAGKYGHQAKQLLEWWIANSISTAVDEAIHTIQYAEQEFSIEAFRFERFDSHYRKMRNLFVTHLQLLITTGPDNFHLFGLYPRDEDQSEILPRMADLKILYERSLQSESQTVNGVTTAAPVEDTEETVQRHVSATLYPTIFRRHSYRV